MLGGHLSRAEVQQVHELLWHAAHSLQERFGEDESVMLARYAPVRDHLPAPPAPAPAAEVPTLPPHEQAAATARARVSNSP